MRTARLRADGMVLVSVQSAFALLRECHSGCNPDDVACERWFCIRRPGTEGLSGLSDLTDRSRSELSGPSGIFCIGAKRL